MDQQRCNILIKLRRIPQSFDKYLRDSDVVFRAHGLFVFVDNENNLNQPYELIPELEAIRLDKRVLRELNDGELGVIINQAKIENELKIVIQNRDRMLDELDYIIEKRYPKWLIDNINEKLDYIYNSM